MRTLTTLATATLIAVGLAGTAAAAPPSVVITGGGTVQNNNSGGPDELIGIGGFVAIAKGDPDQYGIYTDVKGNVQAKTVLAADPTTTVAAIHGKVVCIAELGESIWEIRFQITHVGGDYNPLEVDDYGSLLVRDNGSPSVADDEADESFSNLDSPDCGNLIQGEDFGLEPVLSGNFTVH